MYKVFPEAETREELEAQIRSVVEPVLPVLRDMGYDLTVEEWILREPSVWREDHRNIMGNMHGPEPFWRPVMDAYRQLRGFEEKYPPALVQELGDEEIEYLKEAQAAHGKVVGRYEESRRAEQHIAAEMEAHEHAVKAREYFMTLAKDTE